MCLKEYQKEKYEGMTGTKTTPVGRPSFLAQSSDRAQREDMMAAMGTAPGCTLLPAVPAAVSRDAHV